MIPFLAVLVLAQAGTPSETARIEGMVRDTKGSPIPRATVRLFSDLGGVRSERGVTGGEDGTFVFENVVPQPDYRIFADRPGFATSVYGWRRVNPRGTTMRVAPGEALRDIVIEMSEQSVITGTITDSEGDPVPGAGVTLLRPAYVQGVRHALWQTATQSNELGGYRFAQLQPGMYLVKVTAPGNTGPMVNLTTFYPNATEERSARSIALDAGVELRADIQLRRGRLFSVKGKAFAADGRPLANETLVAVYDVAGVDVSELPNAESTALRARTDADGNFTFQGLPPGAPVIQGLRASAYARVTLTGSDVEDVVLQPPVTVDIAGTMRMDDGDQEVLPSVSLVSRWSMTSLLSGGSRARVAEDGSFLLKSVIAGMVKLNVTGLPAGMYVKSAKLGGNEVAPDLFDISRPAPLEIVLSAKAAVVRGKAASHGMLVTLWSGAHVFTTFSEHSHDFEFPRLPPGVYHLAAWEDADPGLLASAAFRARFIDRATRIEIAEGQRVSVDAPLISAEAYSAEEAKLP